MTDTVIVSPSATETTLPVIVSAFAELLKIGDNTNEISKKRMFISFNFISSWIRQLLESVLWQGAGFFRIGVNEMRIKKLYRLIVACQNITGCYFGRNLKTSIR